MTATLMSSPWIPGGPCQTAGAPMYGTLFALSISYLPTELTAVTPGRKWSAASLLAGMRTLIPFRACWNVASTWPPWASMLP